MARIGLDRFVGGVGGLLVAATLEMPECKRVECGKGPGIERAEAHPPFAPFDRALGFSGPSENNAAEDIGESR